MKEKLSILLVTIVLFATAIVLSGQRPVMAAEAITTCPAVAKAGDIIVYRCVDEENGILIYVNNVGFMSPAE